MTIADVPYLASMHLDNPKNPFTGKLIANKNKSSGIQVIELKDGEPNANEKMKYNYRQSYIIKDNIFEKTNWVLVTNK